jgi:hypothetical protein
MFSYIREEHGIRIFEKKNISTFGGAGDIRL